MKPLEQLRHASVALLVHQGEATARSLAADVIGAYGALEPDDRVEFFRFLREEMSVDHDAILAAAELHRADPSHDTAAALAVVTEPVRQDFLRLLNTAPGGTGAIIGMRTDLLDALDHNPELQVLDRDFLHVLRSWFNRGFLRLVQLDWSTPAFILEKLITYEAVHAIRGWSDLRRRLRHDRRLYAYTHPALPDEPLIFVEVALVDRVVGSIDDVLSQPTATAVEQPDTAIFYSITTTQPGLRGISFGNFLIKQVMTELQTTVPTVRTFATLSPMPGFGTWLRAQPAHELRRWMPGASVERLPALADTEWIDFPATRDALRPGLLQAAAKYLYEVKTDGMTPAQPADPVARFHLRNGAVLHRLNWMGDASPKGIAESAGILVNYLYDPQTLTDNLEAFAREGTVAVSEEVARLAVGEPR